MASSPVVTAIAVLLLATLVKATVPQSLWSDTGRDDVVFTSSMRFNEESRSDLDCARRCTQDDNCLAFSYVTGTSSQCFCRGYSASINSTASTEQADGAKTYNMVQDPCAGVNHVVLDEPWRRVGQGYGENSDHEMNAGWYRFKLNGRNAVVPTTCIGANDCGTVGPMWLDLQGAQLPDVPGLEVTARACASYGGSCCNYQRAPVIIRRCAEYFIYRLLPAPYRWLAYCAAEAN